MGLSLAHIIKPPKNKTATRVLMTIWPVFPVILFAVVGLVHISISSEWRDIYLYSGDSTTLAAFMKSVQNSESLHWIFSSQIFLFPESILYGISFLVTQSIYGSFVANAILNVLLAYWLFYWITRQLFDSRLKSQFVSVMATAVICGYMVLELQPAVNQSAIVTLFLFTTYYYGVVLASLGLIALALYLLKKPSRQGATIATVTAVGVTALTAASNPLLMLQFTLPFCLVIALLWFIGRLPGITAVKLIGSQVAGIILAQIIRIPFKDSIALSANSYINVDAIPQAVHQLQTTASLIASSGASRIEYAVMGSIILCVSVISLKTLYRLFRDRDHLIKQSHILFALFFGSFAPGIIILATLLTGNAYTRYFIPVAFIPFVALFAWASSAKFITQKTMRITLIITTALAILYCVINIPKIQPLTHPIASDAISCFSRQAGDRTVNAVGSFWASRPLDLYSDPSKIRVAQVDNQLHPYPWLNNRSVYDQTFSAVIVDKATPLPSNIGLQHIALLGPASEIWECRDFYVYHYDINSKGYQTLNQRVHQH